MTRLSLVLVLTLLPAAARAADSVPTTEDIRALYEKGEYNDTLKQVARVLSLKGKAAEGFDRYELLILRAESHLRLKATGAALPALEEAAKAAPDDAAVAKARALAILIKRSKQLQYTPKVAAIKTPGAKASGAKGGRAEPISITDDERRPEAFQALYEGERAAATQKVAAATKGKTLPAVATAMKAVAPLRDLELAATGKDDETAKTLDELVKRAQKLMANGLDDLSKRTERIADRANEMIPVTVRRNGRAVERDRRRGLDNNQVRELKNVIDTCRQVIASCNELAEGFAEDDAPFEDLVEQATDTGERANDILSDNYQNER